MKKLTRYSGLQPQYFPRLHYFARILNADIYMAREEVQFVKKHKYPDGKNGPSYQAHTPVKSQSGVFLLQLPIKHNGLQSIKDTQISYDENWQERHLKTIKTNYSNSKNFKRLFPDLEAILNKKYNSVADLNITTILWGFSKILNAEIDVSALSIEKIEKLLSENKIFRLKKIYKGSDMKSIRGKNLTANEKIVELMSEVGAKEDYCGGTAMSAYMEHDIFKRNGISTIVQDWSCGAYTQLFNKAGFIPNLSIIDLLMNESYKNIISVIKGNGKKTQ